MKTVWDKEVIASLVVEEIWRCRIKTVGQTEELSVSMVDV